MTTLATTIATPDLIVFVVAGLMVLLGALGVILFRNPVHSALSLIMTLFGIAVLFIEQRADFLAAVQVIVYAGAIVVLFLFVIMFLGVDRQEEVAADPLPAQRGLAFLMVAVAVGGVIALSVDAHWVTGAHAVAGTDKGINVADIGRSVFTTYLYAFEATAGLLVIAVVGAVVLARRPSVPAEDDPEPVSAAPPSPGGDEEPVDGDPATAATLAAPDGAGEPAGAPAPVDAGTGAAQ